ncbi:MAG: hypothetical protein LUQ71_10420 [Methanoregula sp.]|nr:hypothetical protein [Methanoregula sp.]
MQPPLKVCPDCGAEIPTSRPVTLGRKTVRVQVPVHFCPVCHAPLDVPVHNPAHGQVPLLEAI